MMNFRFAITPEAAGLFRGLIPSSESIEHYVVTIAPHSEARVLTVEEGLPEKAIAEILAQIEVHPIDPRALKLRWVVGASRRDRFPSEDIVDGVPCFVPQDLQLLLDGRTLTLVDGEFFIEPPPPPPLA
jgi:hypothetical protein